MKLYDIMVVDDTPDNLKVLSALLKGAGYSIRPMPRGKLALTAAKLKTPDLLILDINMPEMNGFEVAKAFKEEASLRQVPIIFISAMNDIDSIVKAFSVGGEDYIAKPFIAEEVLKRVEVHLRLSDATKEINDLLSRTFMGSIRLMLDLLSTMKPHVFAQASRIKRIVKMLSQELEMPQYWRYELAAIASRLGLLTIDDKTLSAYLSGDQKILNSEKLDQAMSLGADLISNIPRLELVHDMVVKAVKTPPDTYRRIPLDEMSELDFGCHLLQLVLLFDELVMKNHSYEFSYEKIKALEEYHPALLKALKNWINKEAKRGRKEIHLYELSPGMVLAEDVCTENKIKLLSKGTEVHPNTLSILKRYDLSTKILEPIVILTGDD